MSSDLDTVDVRQQLRLLYQQRVFIVACAVVGAIVGAALALMLPRVYAAEAALVVSRPKIDDQRVGDDRVVVIQEAAETPSTANFRPLVESRAIASRVIADLQLPILQDAFFASVVQVEEVRNSSVLLLRGRLEDRGKVADVVNRVAELATEAARQVSQQEAVQARNDIKVQLDESKARFDSLDKQVAAGRAELAGVDRRNAQTFARESEIKRLERERDLAGKVYEQVANSYESARLMVAARSSGLHVLSRAVPPAQPESRKLARNLTIGVVSGFLLSALFVLIRANLGSL